MKQDPHVDHFIPWSRYPRDLAQNFVLAHSACNLDKGDMLSAPAHLAHWVARWAYSQAEATSAQLWVSLKYTVVAGRNCLEILGE